jgi:aspartate 1-decarboxylase
MTAFAVSLRLPDSFTEEFLAIIPQHRAVINQLLSEHTIETYAISASRGRGWVIVNGEDEEAVRAIVAQFPLYPYLEIMAIDELFIFDSAASRFPHISLN